MISLWKSKFEFYYRVTKVPLYCTATLILCQSQSLFWGGQWLWLKNMPRCKGISQPSYPPLLCLATQVDYLPGEFMQFHASSYILGVWLTHFYLFYVEGIFRRFLRVRSQICQSAANHYVKVVSPRKKCWLAYVFSCHSKGWLNLAAFWEWAAWKKVGGIRGWRTVTQFSPSTRSVAYCF